MVSVSLTKLSSPLVRSCLAAISIGLAIDAAFLIYFSILYPYLIDQFYDFLYIQSSQTLPVICSTAAVAAIIIAALTAGLSYHKKTTNYAVVHAGINGVFLPIIILVYFSTVATRYRPAEFADEVHKMIYDYRISNYVKKDANLNDNSGIEQIKPEFSKTILPSFINHIDALQESHSCCGVDSAQDWIKFWSGYISPSCCKNPDKQRNQDWSKRLNVDETYEFKYCTENNTFDMGCLVFLKEHENDKYNLVCDLLIILALLAIANTFFSLILFGLRKSEESPYETNEHELSVVGISSTSRPSQPTITSIRPRPSVVQTLGQETISSRVRFNLQSNPSRNGPSKFSAAARRGSSFI